MKNTVNAKGTKVWTRASYFTLVSVLVFLAACNSGLEPQVPETSLATQASSCLNGGGKLIKLSGTNRKSVAVRRQSNVRVDARDAKMLGRPPTFVTNDNKGSFCLSGGVYDVGLSLSASWDKYHSSQALLMYNTPNATVENIAVLNTGDGISWKDNNPNWVLRDSYIKHAGDDGIENDRNNSGRVSNVLIDSAFMGVSCRKENRTISGKSLTIENSLIALDARRSVAMWKWTAHTRNSGCKLTLKNNVFLLPKNARHMDPGKNPQIDSNPLNESACRGNKNIVVYTGGDKRYLAELKKDSPTCFTVTTDKSVWTKARDAWFRNHSQFSKYR